MAVTRVITSMLQKAENDNFTKILDATIKEVEFQTAFFSLNAVLYVS